MDDSMHCLALGNVIARQEDGRWEGTDRHSLSCLPGQGKVNSPDDIRVDPDQWVGVRRILFASAERHIHSRVKRRRRSSHGRCRHGI